jgi:hypothetical protein
VPEGKGENEFAFNGAWQDRDTALAIIDSTHRQWLALQERRAAEAGVSARAVPFGEADLLRSESEGCCAGGFT